MSEQVTYSGKLTNTLMSVSEYINARGITLSSCFDGIDTSSMSDRDILIEWAMDTDEIIVIHDDIVYAAINVQKGEESFCIINSDGSFVTSFHNGAQGIEEVLEEAIAEKFAKPNGYSNV